MTSTILTKKNAMKDISKNTINYMTTKENKVFTIVSLLSIFYLFMFLKKESDMLHVVMYALLLIFIYAYSLKLKLQKTASVIYMLLISFSLIEFMTKRMTGFYFHEIPYEIISILYDTNIDEIQSGMHFSRNEIIAISLIIINLLFLVKIKKPTTKRKIHILILPAVVLVFLSTTLNPVSVSASTIYKNKLAIEKAIEKIDIRKSFTWGAKSEENDNQTVVIFLGETHRGDYMSINGYHKKTTPLLEGKGVISFDNAISQAAYTLSSTPMILTRKNVKDYGIFPEKSIISAFKEAGFETWYVSYLPPAVIGDNELNIIANEADHYIQSDVNNDTLSKILSNKSNKKLIVYKTVGSHFLYHTRYPDEYDVFKPSFTKDTYSTPSVEDIELLKNSYENSILYSVDKKVSDFIDILKNEDGLVSLSFISDHGTSIFDDGKSLYGGNTSGNYSIGLFFWFNDKYKSKYHNDIITLEKNKNKKITSEYFVDTILNIGKIKTQKIKGKSLFENNLLEVDRFIVNKEIFNYDKEILKK